MQNRYLEYINLWSNEDETFDFNHINLQIQHLGKSLFIDYEPSIGPKPDFFQRLLKWIDNVEDHDSKKALVKFVPLIFYVGQKEMESLYRAAFNTIVTRWIIDILNISIDIYFESKINEAVGETWFCPITDSMRINQFYHVNNINNNSDLRPEWKSLSVFGSIEKIKDHLVKNKYKRIVLLEDFVGSGNQIKSTIDFAAYNFSDFPLMVVPIIMCPKAEDNLMELCSKYSNLRIEPALKLDSSTFLTEEKIKITNSTLKDVFDVANNSYSKMKLGGLDCSHLGFKNIGATIVLFSNTPNNSLPIIWSENNWYPLFKRHIRFKK